MKPPRISAALLLAAGLSLAPTARAAFDSYMKIDGIAGESKDPAHMGWIAVDSYQFDQIRSAASRSGSGGGAGKVNLSDLTITKFVDQSSPKLFEAVSRGKHIQQVVLEVRKTTQDKSGQPYLVVTLHDVLITSVRPSGSGDENPKESITFNFGKLEMTYTQQRTPTPGIRSVVAASAALAPAAANVPAAPKITGASASAPFTGLGVTVTITSTGPCQSAFVDYGDGSSADGYPLTGTSTTLPVHTYPSAGAKTIKVGGRDAPYWPQSPKKQEPQPHANPCTGWAPVVNVTLRSIVEVAPALKK
jgi:type VI secretion system secreted protein Hcp